jgi:UDP-GlcNAc:undecaprenyl-phosphate GlcNAc-1-phosphate transferase
MVWICLGLIPIALAISWPLTGLVIRWSFRLGALDTAPLPGQVKMAPRRIPNTGGIAIFWGFAIPLIAATIVLSVAGADWQIIPNRHEHLVPVFRERMTNAIALLLCTLAIHGLGLIDDRRPMGPFVKLAFMAGLALIAVLVTDSRMFTLLDLYAGGSWLSVLLTVIWIIVVTNAMNFMDNMDGLSGGVAAICAGCFLATAALHQHWFVACTFALLIGSLLGFLRYNFPPTKIFMGDAGSLVIGFLLAILAVRITYISPLPGPHWHAVLTPLAILAVPLYDFLSVTILRLAKGKSPFVGDLNHFSHRLVRRGLTKRAAVVIIYGMTTTSGLAGILLSHLLDWQAWLLGVQILVTLLVIAIFEYSVEHAPAGEGGKL